MVDHVTDSTVTQPTPQSCLCWASLLPLSARSYPPLLLALQAQLTQRSHTPRISTSTYENCLNTHYFQLIRDISEFTRLPHVSNCPSLPFILVQNTKTSISFNHFFYIVSLFQNLYNDLRDHTVVEN